MMNGQVVGTSYHHDERGYEVARSEAANVGRARFDELIAKGRAGAVKMLQTIQERRIDDALAPGAAMVFAPREGESGGLLLNGSPLHRHALGQLASKAGVPGAYLDTLATSDNGALREQAAQILTTHYRKTDLAASRHLVRTTEGEVRAVLSDRYRRLDSRILLESFAEVCQEYGALPVDATMSDVRVQLKAYLPVIFEPVPNEVMLVGLAWNNSDFGAGAHGASITVLRMWCTNKATGDVIIRQVHSGRRLEAEGVAFSPETIELDTRANASALKDIARSALGPGKVNALMQQIRDAHEQKMTWDALRKRIANGTTKSEQDQIKAAFESDDTINMPAGQTAWRGSNAVSWIAGQVKDTDRRLDLERLSGALMLGERATTAKAA